MLSIARTRLALKIQVAIFRRTLVGTNKATRILAEAEAVSRRTSEAEEEGSWKISEEGTWTLVEGDSTFEVNGEKC